MNGTYYQNPTFPSATTTNYQDTIVFLSESGLEGVVADIELEQSVGHKSSNVDVRMINLSNYIPRRKRNEKTFIFISCIVNDYFMCKHGIIRC